MKDVRREPLYTVAEAARLVQLPYGRARSWLKTRGVAVPDDSLHASFFDVIEMRFIRDLVAQGFPPKKLFAALRDASARLGVSHPLTMKRFLKHGHDLFPADDPTLHLGQGGRRVFGPKMLPGIKEVRFDAHGVADQWKPMDGIIVDPMVQFGSPCLRGTRIPTVAMYDAWVAEDRDLDRVASWYEVTSSAVRDAVRYEESLRPAA